MREWTDFHFCQYLPPLFSREECTKIIGYKDDWPAFHSQLGTGPQLSRDSHLHWIFPNWKTQWLFDRVGLIISAWNEAYGYQVSPQPESFQLTHYGPGQYYDWHMDLGSGGMSRRKISFVAGLNDNYEGGGLEVFFGHEPNPKFMLQPGWGVVFPSFIMHRALAVTSGERWSLVTWLNGEEPLR